MSSRFDLIACRSQFPAFDRKVDGRPAVFLDGPAGSQVPRRVADAVSRYLLETNANHGGAFVTSRESDALIAEAQRGVADLLGTDDPDTIVFGANMTTLTFALSRALARTWKPGDEIVVNRLEHDANFTPWVLAARDAGATVRCVDFRREDCTLDIDDLRSKLTDRTRLVALGCASNAVGTIHPAREVIDLAHEVGAEVFLDAVHFAPHALIDVHGWDCDYLVCSAYKFFGPHVGMLWGRRSRLETLPAYKLRPVGESLPDRWGTGTLNHEGIMGTLEAIEYIADLTRDAGGEPGGRRAALTAAFEAIGEYERTLASRLLRGLAEIDGVRVWGISELKRMNERVPTVSFTHARHSAEEIAGHLARRGVFVWHGNFYALPLTEALELEPEGMVRVGCLHYNTAEEIDRLLEGLRELGS